MLLYSCVCIVKSGGVRIKNVTLNSSFKSNLLALQQTAKMQSLTQNRLATGLKVNSAIDNPNSYYAAVSLGNRASDLSALLDAMSQGVQTIKAAQIGLATASGFLEQATSVINQALEIEPVPTKEWFEQQKNVAAVVTNEAELLSAINSGKKGEIVVYGKIDMKQTVVLKAGQNLVGVGYYGNFDTEVNKFSELKFDFDKYGFAEGIKIISANTIIADLSIKAVAAYDKTTFVINSSTQNNIIQNIDIQIDGNKLNSHDIRGISGGSFELKGKNSIYTYSEQNYTQLCYGIGNSKIVMNDNSVLNIFDNLKSGRAFGSANIVQNDQSQINIISSIGILNSSYTANDKSQLNIKSDNAFYSYGEESVVNINSKDVKIAISAARLFRSDVPSIFLKLNMLEGAKIHYNNKIYEAQSPINRYLGASENIPSELTIVGNSDLKIPDISKIKDIYFKEKKSNNFEAQYNQILKQYDAIIKDTGYKGVNLLTGDDLTINFNEDRSSKTIIQGSSMTASALRLSQASWNSQSDIAKSLSEIASSLKQIRALSEELGNSFSVVSTRESFTKNLISTLQEGADKLTLADMNQESANMLALETRQQLATNALSLASQASQSVLKLF